MNKDMCCKYCGSPKMKLEVKGVHKAIVCESCGKYQKFATKEEVRLLTRDKENKLDGIKPTMIVTDEFEEEVKMSFGRAFNFINNPVTKHTLGIRLTHWKEDVVVRIQFPDENSKMTAPYLYVESRFGRVPWMPNQIEMFSREWVIVYGK